MKRLLSIFLIILLLLCGCGAGEPAMPSQEYIDGLVESYSQLTEKNNNLQRLAEERLSGNRELADKFIALSEALTEIGDMLSDTDLMLRLSHLQDISERLEKAQSDYEGLLREFFSGLRPLEALS